MRISSDDWLCEFTEKMMHYSRKLRVLAISYAFPPMAYPRAIQVSRLLDTLDASIVVLSGEEYPLVFSYQHDSTITPGIELRLEKVLREPFHNYHLHGYIDRLAQSCPISWTRLPDLQRSWVARIDKRFSEWQKISGYQPDVVLTFGRPMSDHFFGLEYKKRTGTPWIAHFSDPWVDNPFHSQNLITSWLNKRMERNVISKADAVLFTCPETLDLVMRKYPTSWSKKAFYIPHSYDQALFDDALMPPDDCYIVRFIGRLYGRRSPISLYEAIEDIACETPALFEGVSFGFVGDLGEWEGLINSYPTAQQIVKLFGVVPYRESLQLMQTAHCLLIIDAPADLSVFFPSKLAEYIGSGRFILALSPRGASSRIVQDVGGLVANPADVNEIVGALRYLLEHKPKKLPRRIDDYKKEVVSAQFLRIIDMVAHNKVKTTD